MECPECDKGTMLYIVELSYTMYPQKLVMKCNNCGYKQTIRRGYHTGYRRIGT